jgi:hypothetical protein
MMENKLANEVKFLKAYAVVSTVVWLVVALAAFAPHDRKQRFNEIDAERINIVEKDGQTKMVLSNKERLPDPGNILTGKFERKREGPKVPGILFYNEKGNETGGLIYVSKEETDGRYISGGSLTFDKYRGDQVIGLQFEEGEGKRSAGLNVWDQPDISLEEQKRNYAEASKLKPGPEQDALMQQAVAHRRVFIGRTPDQSSVLTLSDLNGKPRIRMIVRKDGEPKLEFFDGSGKVTKTLP